MNKVLLTLLFLIQLIDINGQNTIHTKRVLFIGNSYTAVNNLPQMVADVALSAGDTVLFDSNSPGGYTFQMHSVDATTIAKISQGGWDYVVLQEQSQLPSFPISQVETDVFPYAKTLDSLIHQYNPCAETMFYMTWGRKNGDASNCATWPPVCTYFGMDSLLKLRYMVMADTNHAILSPVGAVRRYIRHNFPLIELYQADESHPSIEGTYAAACTFYSSIFRKNPELITFISTLLQADVDSIKHAAKVIAFDSLSLWNIGLFDPSSNFTYSRNGSQISFNNLSSNSAAYRWFFGDGDSSNIINPIHYYLQNGTYQVTLISNHCGRSDTSIQTIQITSSGIMYATKHKSFKLFPNPTEREISIINISNIKANYFLQINDVFGKCILKENILPDSKEINLKLSFEPGIYFLSISNVEAIEFREKIILTK